MSDLTQKISLSFSKKIENKKLSNSALNKNLDISCGHNEAELKHSILSFDKDVQLLVPKKNDEIIIPLVQTNRDAVFSNLKKKAQKVETNSNLSSNEISLDEKAAAAIIKESSEEYISKMKSKSELSIDQIPSVSTSNDLFEDVGPVSTLEEYDKVNIEHFGAALLRGMGWNSGKGIGKNNKRVIDIIDPTTKTFALTNVERKTTEGKREEEEDFGDEELKRGSQVLIHSGRNRGTYGIIESVDEDHILVRPARGDKVLREVEQNVKIVSAKEYKELSRVINKEMYDEFKASESRKKEKRKDSDKADGKDAKKRRENKANDSETKARKKSHADDIDKGEKKVEERKEKREGKYRMEEELTQKDRTNTINEYKQKERKNTIEYNREKEEPTKNSEYKREIDRRRLETNKYLAKESVSREKRTKHYDEFKHQKMQYKQIRETVGDSHKQSHSPVIPWARENLRVRIIDKEYKGGKYHKEKVTVCSVETVDNCTCRTSDGKVLYDVNPDRLETVIPKGQSALIFIVKGKYKGEKGRILELDKEKQKAVIQLLGESSVILKLYYEDICEYVR